MIRRFGSDLASFKTLTFKPGLNILLADKSEGANDRQSRNGAGKTSFVELVHFLFGADARKESIFRSDALMEWTFDVAVDVAGELGIPIGLVEGTEVGGQETADRILAEIAGANDPGAVFGAEAEGIEDLVGQVFSLLDFKYMPSTFDDSEPNPALRWPYVVITAQGETGGRRTLTTGARKCIVQLATWRKLNALPVTVKVGSRMVGDTGRRVYQFDRP